jgi:hypothetical protein
VTGSGASITELELKIARRIRLLAVQDLAALAALLSAALVLTAFVLYRFGVFEAQISEGISIRARLVLCAVPLIASVAFLVIRGILSHRGKWHSKLDAVAAQADLIIDRTLGLDDRASTAGSIIRRGGPGGLMEEALVADTASRLDGVGPEQILEYRLPRLRSAATCPSSTGWAIVLALVVLVGVLEFWLPAGSAQEMDSGTIAVMQTAGDNLEQSSKAIEQSIDPKTPTAALAKQQAELAHALKQSAAPGKRARAKPIDRSRALKELSALEEKLGARKDQLEGTKAPEIIGLAERRFQPALSEAARQLQTPSTARPARARPEPAGANPRLDKLPAPVNRNRENKTAGTSEPESKRESTQAVDKARSDKPTPTASQEPRDTGPPESSSGQGAAGSNQGTRAGDQVKPDARVPETTASETPQDVPKDQTKETSLPSGVADALSSAAPTLSQDLLKKAAEMRAGSLTAADIERFRKAAEGLLKDLSAKDLANLASSKEIQQTLQQLARQVDPKQMEQLAQQLLSQKEIRDELQAVGKLLMENRQAKETIAGFADKAREIAEEFQKRGFRPGGPPNSMQAPLDPSGQAGIGASSPPDMGSGEAQRSYGRGNRGAEAVKGMGRSGEMQRRSTPRGGLIDSKAEKPEGEPIYASSRPGAAPARVPYSSAYPGYRREAERTVQRSQVPPRLRVLVRNYFDGINPDAEKRP